MDIEDIINNKRDILKGIDVNKLKLFITRLVELNPKSYKEFDDCCIIARREVKMNPRKVLIIHYYRKLLENNEIKYDPDLEKLMIKKFSRGTSGVVVITVLTSPFPSWEENGEIKIQKFSCGQNCGYCPHEKQIDLNCKVINIFFHKKNFTVTLKSEDPIDEVRVITYLTLFNRKIVYVFNQKNFDDESKIFNVIILNKYISDIKINDNCTATKIEQPRSYISDEPSVERANRNNFNPVSQFYDRGSALELCGHIIDKVELLVLGGTWSHYNRKYQKSFIRDLYYAANTFYCKIKRNKKSLEEEININETAKCRIIGLTLETRPDCINKSEIMLFRKYGCTRVQIGIQHINDDILKYIQRGCYTKHTIKAINLLKSNGFKVDGHYMPDLPTSNYDIDKDMFDKILGIKSIEQSGNTINYELVCPEIQTDQWKIYPTEVTRWTKIFDMYNEGTYKPYADNINPETGNKYIEDLLIHTKQKVFPWIRLNRVIRDIPNHQIFGGNSVISLRQDLQIKMKKDGKKCNCIRCKEVKGRKINLDDIELFVRRYNDVDADEYFISFESKNQSIIYGFCRMRLNFKDKNVIFEELKNAALIRELHVYGSMVPHDVAKKITQHIGFGKRLVKKAEQIALSKGYNKVAIISGIGVREYYLKKLRYKLEGTYMTKTLKVKKNNISLIFSFLFIILSVIVYIVNKIK